MHPNTTTSSTSRQPAMETPGHGAPRQPSISRPGRVTRGKVSNRLPPPKYDYWEISESSAPLRAPIAHDGLLNFLLRDSYLDPKGTEILSEMTQADPMTEETDPAPNTHEKGADPVAKETDSAPNTHEGADATEVTVDPVQETAEQDVGEPQDGCSPKPANFGHRPQLRFILEHYRRLSEPFPGIETLEVAFLIRHWHLPPEWLDLLSHPNLNPGFMWKRLRTIECSQVFPKETRGFWITDMQNTIWQVLGGITSDVLDLQHPLFFHFRLLRNMVLDLAELSESFLHTLQGSIDDLNKAFSSKSSQFFERYFLQASRAHLYAKRGVFVKLDEAESLVQLIHDSLTDLESAPSFRDSIEISEKHSHFYSKLEVYQKRLHELRKTLQWRDEQVRRNFTILHDLINMRDGRVSKAIAETSAQVARESKRDSTAMKTLAVLTTIFLPPTFIATLFSSPLFNFAPISPTTIVSSQFWIYWAVTIPLTIIVILLWTIWYQWTTSKHQAEDEQFKVNDEIFGELDEEDGPPLLLAIEERKAKRGRKTHMWMPSKLWNRNSRDDLGVDTLSLESSERGGIRDVWQRMRIWGGIRDVWQRLRIWEARDRDSSRTSSLVDD